MKTPLVVRRTRGCLDLLRPRHPGCPDEAEPPGDTCSQSTSSLSVSGIILQIFGGLVWILVACTLVVPENPQGWVMFVSVFCFVMTFIWMVVFACSGHHNKASWAAAVSIQSPQKYLKVGRMVRSGPSDHILITLFPRLSPSFSSQDFVYHGIAAFFYLSASVSLAGVTLSMKSSTTLRSYQLDISAVVSRCLFPP